MFIPRKSLSLGGALVVAACLVGAAVGQDGYRAATTSETHETASNTELVARVAALEAQLKGGMSAGYDATAAGGSGCGCGGSDCGCCDSCCCCNPCCRSEGFYFGAEAGFLTPHNTSGLGLNAFSIGLAGGGSIPLFDATIDPSFEIAPRFWVGYQRCDGLGVRARYWRFDHDFDGTVSLLGVAVPDVTAFHNWDTWVFDAEITDSTRLGCNWDATFSYGYRHVEYDEVRGIADTGVAVFSARKQFSGDGVTTSLEIRRQASAALSLYANVRGSILVSDETNTLALGPFAVTERQTNDIKYIAETQAGVEYTRPTCDGGWYYARAGVELQYWDSFGTSPIALLFDESAGFAGFSFSVGMAR